MTPPQQIPIPIISDREGICRLTSSNRQKPSEMKVMINNTARSWVSLTVVSSNRFCLSFTLSELRSTSPKYLIPFLNVKANSKKTMRTRLTITGSFMGVSGIFSDGNPSGMAIMVSCRSFSGSVSFKGVLRSNPCIYRGTKTSGVPAGDWACAVSAGMAVCAAGTGMIIWLRFCECFYPIRVCFE